MRQYSTKTAHCSMLEQLCIMILNCRDCYAGHFLYTCYNEHLLALQ